MDDKIIEDLTYVFFKEMMAKQPGQWKEKTLGLYRDFLSYSKLTPLTDEEVVSLAEPVVLGREYFDFVSKSKPQEAIALLFQALFPQAGITKATVDDFLIEVALKAIKEEKNE